MNSRFLSLIKEQFELTDVLKLFKLPSHHDFYIHLIPMHCEQPYGSPSLWHVRLDTAFAG